MKFFSLDRVGADLRDLLDLRLRVIKRLGHEAFENELSVFGVHSLRQLSTKDYSQFRTALKRLLSHNP